MTNKTQIIEALDGSITHRQGAIPVIVLIRHWLIRKIAGNMPVFLNLEVRPHTQEECAQAFRLINCKNGIFYGGSIRAKADHGITMQQTGKGE